MNMVSCIHIICSHYGTCIGRGQVSSWSNGFLENSECPGPTSSPSSGSQRYGARNPMTSMFPTTPSVWVDHASRGVKQCVKCGELEAVGQTFYQSSDV